MTFVRHSWLFLADKPADMATVRHFRPFLADKRTLRSRDGLSLRQSVALYPLNPHTAP